MTAPDADALEKQIEKLLSTMTLGEKIALLSGKDDWRTVSIDRLGIPSVTLTDGPHGVRATGVGPARIEGSATSFPTGISMAASWNVELIDQVGAALARETRALGCDVLLGPCVNIVRVPLAGRNFETLSEDPYLAGCIGAAYVRGVQGAGVGTSPKHYVCNNQETERMRGSVVVDERTLREIYLSAFEMLVKEAQPWTVMAAYNRINGVYATQHHWLLNEILKGEWGFDGVVVSDWGATHATVPSIKGGLDLEMPGPAKYYGDLLVDAVQTWDASEEMVDESVRRVLRMVIRSGRMEGARTSSPAAINTPKHEALARRLAEDSVVLLKNEHGILPLGEDVETLAVVGPNADEASIGGGGSSYVEPPYRIGPLEGLRSLLGGDMEIGYEQGCDNYDELPPLPGKHLVPPSGEGHGLKAAYFDTARFVGETTAERIDPYVHYQHLTPPEGISPNEFSVRWTGTLISPRTGPHTLKLVSSNLCRIYVEDQLVLEVVPDAKKSARRPAGCEAQASLDLVADKSYALRIEYAKPARTHERLAQVLFGFSPRPEDDDRFDRAIALARKSDLAIVFAGTAEGYETEGRDRLHMDLPGRQDELIEAVAQANPNTIVVLNCGAPVAMPWVDQVSALLLAFHPGQEGGRALARIVAGDANPSGKLPVTFPSRLQDTPSYINYPGARAVHYGEGIFVGYRYYDQKDIEPLFPFGHGLSYTTFSYSNLVVPRTVEQGRSLDLSVRIENTGDSPGQEVVQLYVRDVASTVARPPKELKGFHKVALHPGESKTVHFTLGPRALSFYDVDRQEWVAEPGEFEVLVGSSSRSILERAIFTLLP